MIQRHRALTWFLLFATATAIDLGVRFLVPFQMSRVLWTEAVVFMATAMGILALDRRMTVFDATPRAWPKYVAAFFALGAVRSCIWAAGKSAFVANMGTLSVALGATGIVWWLRRRTAGRMVAALMVAVFLGAPAALRAQGLPRAKPEEVGLSTTALQRIAPMLQAQLDSQHFTGLAFAVARHGKLAFSGAVGKMNAARATPMRTDALFRIFSMTKAVTATAVMQQVERGRLKLDDPVAKHIPAFEQVRVFAGGSSTVPTLVGTVRPVTIEQLLRHTAGLTYGVFGTSPVDSMYVATRLLVAENTIGQFADKVARLPLLFQPGEKWNYSMAMDVLARVVEVTSGKRYDRYLADELFAPLGMRETAHHVAPGQERRVVVMDARLPGNKMRPGRDAITPDLRDEGKLFAGGQGLVSTMADYLRFTQMLLNGGTLDGHRVLKQETVATMMTDHLPTRLSPLASAIDMKGYGQGYGGVVLVDSSLSQMPASPGTYRWCGYAGTYFWIDPRRDLIAMMWGQLAGGCPHPVAAEFERMVYAAVMGK